VSRHLGFSQIERWLQIIINLMLWIHSGDNRNYPNFEAFMLQCF